MSSEQLHEAADQLRTETIDHHRAVSSLMEEFEAVDWYDQRIDATNDIELAGILRHNRDEEKEHASMVLEWLRRHDPLLDEHLHTYLFTEGSILEEEQEEGSAGASLPGAPPSLPGAPSSLPGAAPSLSGEAPSLGIGPLGDKELL